MCDCGQLASGGGKTASGAVSFVRSSGFGAGDLGGIFGAAARCVGGDVRDNVDFFLYFVYISAAGGSSRLPAGAFAFDFAAGFCCREVADAVYTGGDLRSDEVFAADL